MRVIQQELGYLVTPSTWDEEVLLDMLALMYNKSKRDAELNYDGFVGLTVEQYEKLTGKSVPPWAKITDKKDEKDKKGESDTAA